LSFTVWTLVSMKQVPSIFCKWMCYQSTSKSFRMASESFKLTCKYYSGPRALTTWNDLWDDLVLYWHCIHQAWNYCSSFHSGSRPHYQCALPERSQSIQGSHCKIHCEIARSISARRWYFASLAWCSYWYTFGIRSNHDTSFTPGYYSHKRRLIWSNADVVPSFSFKIQGEKLVKSSVGRSYVKVSWATVSSLFQKFLVFKLL